MSANAASARDILSKVQGGTGKHVDGSVTEPLANRPFQALVQLSDAAASGHDGSLHVLPGFHAASLRYFQLAGQQPPAGGFTPLVSGMHDDIRDPALWLPAQRMPKRWHKLYASGKLPPACGAALARSREGLIKKLGGLVAELRAMGYASEEIAELLGLTLRTFERRFARARARLHAKMPWMPKPGPA